MQSKVYVITEIDGSGREKVIAARLTNEAARSIAKMKANRRVTRLIATKDLELVQTDYYIIEQHKKEQHDVDKTNKHFSSY